MAWGKKMDPIVKLEQGAIVRLCLRKVHFFARVHLIVQLMCMLTLFCIVYAHDGLPEEATFTQELVHHQVMPDGVAALP